MQSKIAFLPQMNNFNQMFVAKLCHIIVAPSPFVHRGSGNIYDITWRYFGNNLSQHDGSSLKWTVRSGKTGRKWPATFEIGHSKRAQRGRSGRKVGDHKGPWQRLKLDEYQIIKRTVLKNGSGRFKKNESGRSSQVIDLILSGWANQITKSSIDHDVDPRF